MKQTKKITILHSNDLHGDFLAEQVDENGFISEVYKQQECYGEFAENIASDLSRDNTELEVDYEELQKSDLLVLEYAADGKVKIAVQDWSEDAGIRVAEEALIEQLVKLGARIVSEAEIERLTSVIAIHAA